MCYLQSHCDCRTVSAVNYQYKTGPTEIGFAARCCSRRKGGAMVESKTGRTEVEAHFEHLAASQKFGANIRLTCCGDYARGQRPQSRRGAGERIGQGAYARDDRPAGFRVDRDGRALCGSEGASDVVVIENEIRPRRLAHAADSGAL